MTRGLFLCVCLIPSAGLVGWGWHWRGDAHRESVLEAASTSLGCRLTAKSLEHPLPGVLELHGLRATLGPGGERIEVDSVRIGRHEGVVRVTLPHWRGTSPAFASAARLLRGWLDEPLRHPMDWVVEVGSLGFDSAEDVALDGVRVECVGDGDTRAVRIRREPFDGDELRVRRKSPESDEAEPIEPGASAGSVIATTEVDAELSRPVPLAWFGAVTEEWSRSAARLSGRVSGRLALQWRGTSSDASCTGGGAFRIDSMDAASWAAWVGVPSTLEGRMTIDVEEMRIEQGRIPQATALLRIESGVVSRAILDRCVDQIGCLPGEAFESIRTSVRGGVPIGATAADMAGDVRPFALLSCRLTVREGWLSIEPPDGRRTILEAPDGRCILMAPTAAVSVERVAWAFAPASARMVPLSPMLEAIVPFLGGGDVRSVPAGSGN